MLCRERAPTILQVIGMNRPSIEPHPLYNKKALYHWAIIAFHNADSSTFKIRFRSFLSKIFTNCQDFAESGQRFKPIIQRTFLSWPHHPWIRVRFFEDNILQLSTYYSLFTYVKTTSEKSNVGDSLQNWNVVRALSKRAKSVRSQPTRE